MESKKHIEEIIQQYLDGTATKADLEYLLNWMKASRENVKYFNQICSIWENTTNIGESENGIQDALKNLNARINAFEEENQAQKLLFIEPTKSYFLLRFAAIIILLLGVSIFFFLISKKPVHKSPEWVTIIAPRSQKSQVILSDGTKVWLNSGTVLKYKSNYGEKERQILLNGEAYFCVAKNPQKPFFVHAANITVRAIGTTFNVRCYSEDNIIETTLIEGKVQVTDNGSGNHQNIVYLLPSQRAIFNRKDNKLLVAKTEPESERPRQNENTVSYIQPKSIESVISWKNEQLVFENESFDELTKRLERWYNVDIQIINPSRIIHDSYTGKFVNNETLEQVLKIVSRTTPIKFNIQNKKVTIEVKE